jgi:hypothetical protein
MSGCYKRTNLPICNINDPVKSFIILALDPLQINIKYFQYLMYSDIIIILGKSLFFCIVYTFWLIN